MFGGRCKIVSLSNNTYETQKPHILKIYLLNKFHTNKNNKIKKKLCMFFQY